MSFAIGQTVTLLPLRLRKSAPGDYVIMRLLPDDFYRIKSKQESYERVVAGDELTLSTTIDPFSSPMQPAKALRGFH
jgi:hypothetical protein